MSQRLRYVVIGAGAVVFNMHRPALNLNTVELVAVSDIDKTKAEPVAAGFNCELYQDHQQMLAEVQPDVAVIMTPHPYHAPQAIDCLAAGCHVLVEKPMAVQVAEADQMIAAAEQANRLLAVNFQQRFRPEVEAAYQLIQSGRLGHIQHVDMALSWPRTAVYFNMGSWRATWKGEGGGVLMNQAPHDLDLICHLIGIPQKLVAWTATTLQQIEVEDTIQAMLAWKDGAMGSLHISTAQGKRPYRLEIIGTKGTLNIAQGKLTFHEFAQDMADFIRTNPEPFPAVDSQEIAVEMGSGTGDHTAVYQNFHQAIQTGSPIRADGRQGRMSLELANAMIYSSQTGQEVTLPLDREAYGAVLQSLRS